MATKSICIIGRINVGKSTLFNRLTKSWSAIVEDTPGVTRDRKEGQFVINEKRYRLIDTGGIDPQFADEPSKAAQDQARIAISEADVIIFLVDVRAGILTGDYEIATLLKTSNKPIVIAVNKVDHPKLHDEIYEFMQLGFGEPIAIAAEHKLGLEELKDAVEAVCTSTFKGETGIDDTPETSLAIVGRANVGKSSLINSLLGTERHIVTEFAGTTRDSIDSLYTYNDITYRLIDTAGIRKLGQTKNKIDKISTMMARQSLTRCDVAILVIDAQEGISAQDARVGGYIVEAGKGCLIAANKWDLTPKTEEYYKKLKSDAERKFAFMSWAPIMTISASTKQRIFKLFQAADKIKTNLQTPVSTTALNRVLQQIQKHHPPPRRKQGRAVKFFYATQIYTAPPTFLIFTNTLETIHFSYKRYMENTLRQEFNLHGCPVRLIFKHKRD
jgi:GTPase